VRVVGEGGGQKEGECGAVACGGGVVCVVVCGMGLRRGVVASAVN
jgi:hypothetical protein